MDEIHAVAKGGKNYQYPRQPALKSIAPKATDHQFQWGVVKHKPEGR